MPNAQCPMPYTLFSYMRSLLLPKKLSPKLLAIILTLAIGSPIILIASQMAASIYLERGWELQKQGEIESAIAAYHRAIQLNPHYDLAYDSLGWALRQQGKLEPAIAAYQKAIQLNPKNQSAYLDLGQSLHQQNQLDQAIAAYNKAIQLNPQDTLAYIALSGALLKQDKLDEALKTYDKAIQINPSLAEEFKSFKQELTYAKKQNQALAKYRQAIQRNPKDDRAYNNLGKELHKQGKLEQAITAYRQAIQLDPKRAITYNNLANALADQENFTAAIAAYRQAIQLDPKRALFYNNLGIALSNQGKLTQAIAAYQQALKLNPQQPVTYNNLGNALQHQSKLTQAITLYQRAITLDPNYQGVKDNLLEAQRLLALQKNPQLASLPEQLSTSKADPLFPLKRAVVRIIAKNNINSEEGTGWIVKREGNQAWVITNRHVVTEKDEQQPHQNIEIEFFSQPPPGQFRKRSPAKIVGITSANDQLDLALLEISDIPQDIQPLPLSRIPAISSQSIRVIGHQLPGNYWTVVDGELSNTTQRELQLSAILTSGYSGSPVLDQQNYVVGVAAKVNLACQPNYQAERIVGCGIAFPVKLVKEKLNTWGILSETVIGY